MREAADTVIRVTDGDAKAAEDFSGRTGIPISDEDGEALTLTYSKDGVRLDGYGLSFTGDFGAMKRRVTGGRLSHEMLVRVAKTKAEHPTAIDATAGMGEDSFLLAAAGYEVTLFERDPVISELLRDALCRAKCDPELSDIISRMHLVEGDSIEGMKTLGFTPDIVYLDPMFPERKKSGLIGKKLQLIQKLECPCPEEEELFAAAMSTGAKKIVIKRPLKGAFLAGKKPGYTVKGKAIRYDCIVT